MRVLITGGAGFIGSHLCVAMLKNGHSVSVLDNLSTGSKDNISHLGNKLDVIQGDIRNKVIVESLTEKADLVLHMAAALGVTNILKNPIESISTNYFGSEVVLNAALKFDKRIFIASTSEIYGKNTKDKLSETDDRILGTPQKLRWTYSDAKALEEAMAHHLFVSKGLKVTTLRLFNTVGPKQTGKYGMVLPRFINAAIKNEPIIIFGNGKQSRVFCHVYDAIEAILSLIDNDNSIGEVFNIGGKDEISIYDLANKIIIETKSKSDINFVAYDDAYGIGFEDMTRRVPDISKIKSFTNWEPRHDLSKIITDIVKQIV
jgi:UDP-glucose 4-epimerase